MLCADSFEKVLSPHAIQLLQTRKESIVTIKTGNKIIRMKTSHCKASNFFMVSPGSPYKHQLYHHRDPSRTCSIPAFCHAPLRFSTFTRVGPMHGEARLFPNEVITLEERRESCDHLNDLSASGKVCRRYVSIACSTADGHGPEG